MPIGFLTFSSTALCAKTSSHVSFRRVAPRRGGASTSFRDSSGCRARGACRFSSCPRLSDLSDLSGFSRVSGDARASRSLFLTIATAVIAFGMIAFTLIGQPALAKEMPPLTDRASAGSAAGAQSAGFAGSAKQSVATLNPEASILAPVAYKQPNRIYIRNGKIVRAVGDTALLQLDPDPATGSLYVIPLTKEQTGLFVVSESGETHSLTLAPKERLISQTVALTNAKSPFSSAGLPGAFGSDRDSGLPSELAALPYEARVQRILRAIPALSAEHGEALKGGTITDGVLIGNPMRAWALLGLKLERYRLRNPTAHTIAVREANFYQKGVVAVATEADALGPQGSVDLWIVRERAQ